MASADSDVVALADGVSALFYAVAGWMLVGLGSFAAWGALVPFLGDAPANVLFSVALFLFAVVFVVSGVFVNPWFRRRIDRRHPLRAFGRVKSVDDRTVDEDVVDGDIRCVVCGARVDRGLVRHYRDEYAVAGLPVWTVTEGRNSYCVECGLDELSDGTEDRPENAETDADVDVDVDPGGERTPEHEHERN
jgi:hypothetical protein